MLSQTYFDSQLLKQNLPNLFGLPHFTFNSSGRNFLNSPTALFILIPWYCSNKQQNRSISTSTRNAFRTRWMPFISSAPHNNLINSNTRLGCDSPLLRLWMKRLNVGRTNKWTTANPRFRYGLLLIVMSLFLISSPRWVFEVVCWLNAEGCKDPVSS